MLADLIIQNTREVVTPLGAGGPKKGRELAELHVIADGAIASSNGRIVAVGPRKEVLSQVDLSPDARVLDAGQRVVVPGFVDPHTHLLFAGGREDEFLMRVRGESYLEIGRKGGGIVRTTAATRSASQEALVAQGRAHLDMMVRQGTTSVEIKSGYGLSTESEVRMLRATQVLRDTHLATIRTTFLGAHAVPPEFKSNPDRYVDLVINEMLPAVHAANLADYCDVFCETGYFDVDQSRQILRKAKALGMKLKVHGNELAPSGGCRLAAEMGAVSVDHCNCVDDVDLDAMAAAGTMAVGLPGTPFFKLAPSYADGRRIIDAGVALALATDYNPTASISSMHFVMFLGCLEMGLDPAEALCASTLNAAYAMGVEESVGSLEVGKSTDALFLDIEDFRHIPFYVGRDIIDLVVKTGNPVAGKRHVN
jgi:imidazolonepropionase